MGFDEFLRKLRNPLGKVSFHKLTTETDQSLIELEDVNRSTFSPKSVQLTLASTSDSDEETSVRQVRPGNSDGFAGSSNDFDRKIYNSPTQDISESRHYSASTPSPFSLKSMLGIRGESGSSSKANDDLDLDLGTSKRTQDLLGQSSGTQDNHEEHCPEIELLGPRSRSVDEQRNRTNANRCLFGLRGIRLYLILAMIFFVLTILVAVTKVFIKDSDEINAFSQYQNGSYQHFVPIPDVKDMNQPAENHTNDSALMKMLSDKVPIAVAPKSLIPQKIEISPELIRESFKTALNSFKPYVIRLDNEITQKSPDYSPKELQIEEHALVMELAYRIIVKKLNLSIEQADQGDNLLKNATLPLDLCPELISNEPQCDKIGKYRSLDGTCNHKNQFKWGSVNEPYRRLVFPQYEDGISATRSLSFRKKTPLPSARLVSSSVHIDVNQANKDDEASMMMPLWAHFISHDIMHTAKSAFGSDSDCCRVDKSYGLTKPESCFEILVPPADPFYKNKTVSCLDFHRAAPHASCNFVPRQQINKATSYIDASQIYGVTSEILKLLRVEDPLKKGQMKLEAVKNTILLPSKKNLAKYVTTHCLSGREDAPASLKGQGQCFMSGDDRVNEIVTITALQTIWVRQHNQLAQTLSNLNQNWTDEKVFQETRKIIIAQIQHITFTEFLPVILGTHFAKEDPLIVLHSNYSNDFSGSIYYSDYDIKTNPEISNEFTIAFQFYISMMQGFITLKSDPRQDKIDKKDNLKLREMMLNPFLLIKDGGMLDKLLVGVANQPVRKLDAYISGQFTNHMYQLPNNNYGTDMVALIIQQSRDQGMSYLPVAKKCGLHLEGKDIHFSSLKPYWDEESLKRVESVYESVEDIDLFTGLLSELPATFEDRLGPTLSCIIIDQFSRLRKGDMFWYDGDIFREHFNPEQLKEIRKTSLAKIICNNSDKIRILQPEVMFVSSDHHEVMDCSELPNIKLDAWKETKHQFHENIDIVFYTTEAGQGEGDLLENLHPNEVGGEYIHRSVVTQ